MPQVEMGDTYLIQWKSQDRTGTFWGTSRIVALSTQDAISSAEKRLPDGAEILIVANLGELKGLFAE